MPRRLLCTALAVVAIAALISACGSSGSGGSSGSSSSGVSAAEYVKAICTAVGPFEKDVAARSNKLNTAKLTSAAQGKKAVQDFLTAVSSDTDQALTKLQAAGTPDIANGKAISTTIVAAFKQLQTAIGTALTQAKNLSTSSPQAFQKGATQLGGTVQSSLSGISTSLGKLKSADLEKAAAKEPACTSLNGA
jgi:hypothetical protein